MDEKDLTGLDSHFSFGKNWESYARAITEDEIDCATQSLSRLLGRASIAGLTFLDIGCGSGVHSLAALRLGARHVTAVDIDPDSTSTTTETLRRYWPGDNYTVIQSSVFDMPAVHNERYEVVYSWGVLHHTGDMHRAIQCASEMVESGGELVFALYRRVLMDGFWAVEKRWYAAASPAAQSVAQKLYVLMFRVGLFLTGRSYQRYIAGYKSTRGMDFRHDIHDWLGGWPYESISAGEVRAIMAAAGLVCIREFIRPGRFFGRHLGFFGSGCDEYVYRRSGPGERA